MTLPSLITDAIDSDPGPLGDNKKGIRVLYVLRLSFGGWLGLDVDIYFTVSFDQRMVCLNGGLTVV